MLLLLSEPEGVVLDQGVVAGGLREFAEVDRRVLWVDRMP